MKKALGYTRVSGKTQATHGTGLQEQHDAVAAWAERNGYEIVEWFEDAITGEMPWDKRPAMHALVKRLAVNGIDAVILHQIDRLTRGKAAISEDFLAVVQAAGVQVISTIDGVLTDVEGDEFKSADAELVRTIKQGIVRAEKRKLVARMALGRMRAKAAGKSIGGVVAFGSDPNKPEEKVTLARIFQLHRAGLTCYGIAKQLTTEGIRTRYGAEFKPQTITNILGRRKPDGDSSTSN